MPCLTLLLACHQMAAGCLKLSGPDGGPKRASRGGFPCHAVEAGALSSMWEGRQMRGAPPKPLTVPAPLIFAAQGFPRFVPAAATFVVNGGIKYRTRIVSSPEAPGLPASNRGVRMLHDAGSASPYRAWAAARIAPPLPRAKSASSPTGAAGWRSLDCSAAGHANPGRNYAS